MSRIECNQNSVTVYGRSEENRVRFDLAEMTGAVAVCPRGGVFAMSPEQVEALAAALNALAYRARKLAAREEARTEALEGVD